MFEISSKEMIKKLGKNGGEKLGQRGATDAHGGGIELKVAYELAPWEGGRLSGLEQMYQDSAKKAGYGAEGRGDGVR